MGSEDIDKLESIPLKERSLLQLIVSRLTRRLTNIV